MNKKKGQASVRLVRSVRENKKEHSVSEKLPKQKIPLHTQEHCDIMVKDRKEITFTESGLLSR